MSSNSQTRPHGETSSRGRGADSTSGRAARAHGHTGSRANGSGPFGESWRAWTALVVGVLAVSAHAASSITFSVVMKPILAEFDWERTSFASAMTLRMLVMVVAMPVAGLMTDRIGPRRVLAAGALVIGLGNLTLSRFQSLAGLHFFMACMGPGQAAIGAVAASALVLRRFRRRRGLAIGVLNGGDNLINSAVPILAALSLAAAGWRQTIAGLGGTYVVLAGLILWALPSAAEPEDVAPAVAAEGTDGGGRGGLGELPWRDARLWILFFAYACIYAYITSVQLHLHAFQTDLGRSNDEASRVLSTLILVGAAGAPLFGWLAERISARGALVAVVACLAATSFALWSVRSPAALTAWAVAYGLVNGGVVALLALVLSEMFGTRRIGRLMGVAMVFCMGSTMIANLYAASTFDRLGSYEAVWKTYSVLMVLASAAALLLWRGWRGR
jgi:MFS family permease